MKILTSKIIGSVTAILAVSGLLYFACTNQTGEEKPLEDDPVLETTVTGDHVHGSCVEDDLPIESDDEITTLGWISAGPNGHNSQSHNT